MLDWYTSGKLVAPETVVEGFDRLPDALAGILKGDNRGKMVVKNDL